MAEPINLPDIICLHDYEGNYNKYIDAIYEIFHNDFVRNKPFFRGKRLGLKHYPEYQGRAYTFYHMTHSGSDEQNRQPDMRRCERIPYAKPTIEKCDAWEIKVWTQERNGKKRICIWLELPQDIDYIVILDDRDTFILPWTAFVLQYPHEKRKKQREYDDYLARQNS